MPRAPDVIIVARHGARLDAADREWHLSSPTPYDPPLTYGGWNQSKALGTRIASLLHARALSTPDTRRSDSVASTSSVDAPPSWKRRYKIVLHTSPFLRCIQTSIAIGAGIEQFEAPGESQAGQENQGKRKGSVQYYKQHARSSLDMDRTKEEIEAKRLANGGRRDSVIPHAPKAVLRVDAFLGEWYTREYYEDITAPPESTLMMAGAKAELLCQEQIDIFEPSAYAKGNFPGGWSRAGDSADDMLSRPRFQRANTHGDGAEMRSTKDVPSSVASSSTAYIAPIPAYAVSAIDPIPKGYVTHAKDACLEVDMHWDSMRDPQDWGDGGELGETWSHLQKRLRTGLFRMISWYRAREADEPTLNRDTSSRIAEVDEDEDTELVLILVTHSAGCNALVGALTNQPVLLDFGTASLTVAVRKTDARAGTPLRSFLKTGDGASLPRRRSSVDFGLSEEYEMQLKASTDHLRAAADTSRITALQSPNLVPKIPAYSRSSTPTTGAQPIGAIYRPQKPTNSALGSIRRSKTVSTSSSAIPPPISTAAFSSKGKISSTRTRASTANTTPTPGLWSANRSTNKSATPSPPATSPIAASPTSIGSTADSPTSLNMEELSLGPSLREAQHNSSSGTAAPPLWGGAAAAASAAKKPTGSGLWGSGPSNLAKLSEAVAVRNPVVERVQASKRRWTVNENDGGGGFDGL